MCRTFTAGLNVYKRTAAARKPVASSHKDALADVEARALHGRLVTKVFHVPGSGKRQTKTYWGRLLFRGPIFRPNYFQVTWEDGDWTINSLPRLKASGHVLHPEGTALPPGVSIPTATGSSTAAWEPVARCWWLVAGPGVEWFCHKGARLPRAPPCLLWRHLLFAFAACMHDGLC